MVETLVEIISCFQNNRLLYCLIGGLAMLLHGGRANTVDIDLYVLVNDLEEVMALFQKNGWEVRKAGDYQLKAKVKGVPVDILLADHYVGEDVVKRAAELKLGDHFVRVATPEDIIVLKSIAVRSVDRRDIEELRELFAKTLDEKYITNKLKKIKEMLES